MTKKKLFNSKQLLNYYKEGILDNILKKFKKEINEKTFLGAGCDASGFIYGKKEVLKICPKTIGYFRKSGLNGENLGNRFQEHINSLFPYFLPINQIIYEDDKILIYTQYFCQKVTREKISEKKVSTIFQMVKLMLENNCISTDIGLHNMGMHKGHFVLFDYHGMHPIMKNGHMPARKWWGRLSKNLTKYMTYIYAPNRIENYSQLMRNLNEKSIKEMKKEDLLPSCFINLLKYFVNHRANSQLNEVIDLLDLCIRHLENSH